MKEYNTLDSDKTIDDLPEDAELQSLAPQMTLCGGKFRLEKEAGRGGMGVVWKAYDTISERYVALKFVPQEIRHFDTAMEQIRLAFRTIQDLNHQNIRPVYGLEKDPGMGYFVVMKWLEGESLDAVQLTREQKMTVLEKVAAALDYAHEHGVVHRDVKPSNIFLQMDGNQISEVFLVDFGISAEVQNSMSQHTGAVVHTSGTRAFMPPEQWRGQTQDGRTDQYALAAVAYWLFAGRLPFHVADAQMLRDCVLLDMPDPIPGENPKLNAAIMRGLAKQRQDRFKSCQKLLDAMLGEQSAQPVKQLKQSKKDGKQSSKYPLPFTFYSAYWIWLVLSFGISLVLLMFVGYFLQGWESESGYIREFYYDMIGGIGALAILNCGLLFSQIIWNVIKNHKFQLLYGIPLPILGFVLATQGLILTAHSSYKYGQWHLYQHVEYAFYGLIIGNIISLIFFSFKEKWLAPDVWNNPRSWFRLRNLIIGWVLYFILIGIECGQKGFFEHL